MDKLNKPTILHCLNRDKKKEFMETIDIDPKTIFIANVATDASGNAIFNALNNGRSVTIMQGNSIVEVYPDGRRDIIKELDKSSVIPKKRVYHL